MTKKETELRKYQAQLLFIHESLTQKEIAARVGISEVTISKWANKGKWENLKVSITITKEEQLKSLYRQLSAMNNSIAEREQKYATAAEADIISKIANAISKMETDIGVSDIVGVGKKWLTWLREYDLRKAQEITPLFDAFIKNSLR